MVSYKKENFSNEYHGQASLTGKRDIQDQETILEL